MDEKNKLHVLLVDDDDAFRLLVGMVMRSQKDLAVSDCDSGECAIEELKRQKFDVVLLDYKMPGLSGLNVMQWMHEQKMDTPVIMVTAAGSETIAVEAMKLGAYDYFNKESVDVYHVPHAIRSVHERHLFRLDREKQQREEMHKEETISTITLFRRTSHSLERLVNDSLNSISTILEQTQQGVKPHLDQKGLSKFNMGISDLRQEFSIIAAGTRSLFNLSLSMTKRIEPEHEVGEQEFLEQQLELIPEQKTSSSAQ